MPVGGTAILAMSHGARADGDRRVEEAWAGQGEDGGGGEGGRARKARGDWVCGRSAKREEEEGQV